MKFKLLLMFMLSLIFSGGCDTEMDGVQDLRTMTLPYSFNYVKYSYDDVVASCNDVFSGLSCVVAEDVSAVYFVHNGNVFMLNKGEKDVDAEKCFMHIGGITRVIKHENVFVVWAGDIWQDQMFLISYRGNGLFNVQMLKHENETVVGVLIRGNDLFYMTGGGYQNHLYMMSFTTGKKLKYDDVSSSFIYEDGKKIPHVLLREAGSLKLSYEKSGKVCVTGSNDSDPIEKLCY